MKEIPEEWKNQIYLEDYLLQLFNSQFVKVDDWVFLDAHYSPENLKQWTQSLPPKLTSEDRMKLENTINHVHLDDFTTELGFQKKIGQQL